MVRIKSKIKPFKKNENYNYDGVVPALAVMITLLAVAIMFG